LEVVDDLTRLGMWAFTDQNFANWKTNTGSINSLNGTETIDTNGYATSSFVGANAGTDLFTANIVIDDKNDSTRDVNPWLGAYEGGVGINYYWVGEGGLWSDFASHWATTSGGSTFHSSAPAALDDVYFDANSFTGPGVVLTLDAGTWYCNTLQFLDITKTPVIIGSGVLIVGDP